MRAKAMSSMGPACAAAVLVLAGSSGAAHAEPLGCRRAVAWDVASDLVAYELPRECERKVGTIYPIEPSKVSKRVRRFAAEARDAARGATLLQAVAVDNDGFTLTMLLVVADERVRAIFAADDFEE